MLSVLLFMAVPCRYFDRDLPLAARQLAHELRDLVADAGQFLDEFLGGHAGNACVDRGELQQLIVCYGTDAVIRPQCMHHFFNVCIGSLVGLGVYDLIIIVHKFRPFAALYKIGIKHKHKLNLGLGNVAAEQIHQLVAGLFQADQRGAS